MEAPSPALLRESLRNTLKRIQGVVDEPAATPAFLEQARIKLRQWYLELVELSESHSVVPLAGGAATLGTPPAAREVPAEARASEGSETPADRSGEFQKSSKREQSKKTSRKEAKKEKKAKKDKKTSRTKESRPRKSERTEEDKPRLRSRTPLVTPAREEGKRVRVKEEPEETEAEERSAAEEHSEEEARKSRSKSRHQEERHSKSPRKDSRSPVKEAREKDRERHSRGSRPEKESPEKRRLTPGEGSSTSRPKKRSREDRDRSARRRRAPRSPSPRKSGSLRPREPTGPPPGFFRPPANQGYQWWGQHPSNYQRIWVKNRGKKNRERNEDIYQYGCSGERRDARLQREADRGSK